MHAIAPEGANTNVFRVWPSEAPSTQHGANESELVARLQARDETAFREIVERYGPKVYQVSYGILGNREDADETAQEVFAKVHFAIRGFGGRSSLFSWIYRITVNECYGLLRKKRVRRLDSTESSGETTTRNVEAVADERATPDRIALQRDFLNKLLAKIPHGDRWLLLSKEVEGFSLAELSQMTGLTVNAIKGRLFRARRDLLTAAAQSAGA
jgi:RNA polymerase sigma-70 factor (ECF subfamily)